MKNILSIITLLLLAAAPSSMGQGQISFNNRVIGQVVAPIYGTDPSGNYGRFSGNATTNGGSVDYTGFTLLSGTGYTAELWAEYSAGSDVFQPLSGIGAKVPFLAGTRAGFIAWTSQAVFVPWVTTTAMSVRFQVRAWDNKNGFVDTYAASLASGASSGWSDIFTTQVNVPPGTPLGPVGLTSFNLIGPAMIPEPSVVMLAALAGVALLWRRRVGRKS